MTETGGTVPSGSCLNCGYDRPWTIWYAPKGEPLIGLCAECKSAPEKLQAALAVVEAAGVGGSTRTTVPATCIGYRLA